MVFDLEESGTYYTRPMSPPGFKPLDVDRLVDRGADVDFSLSLAELPRLRSRLASVEGTVHGLVHFERESRLPVAQVSMSGSATLLCQRCLQKMQVPVQTSARVALIYSEADVSRVPEYLEPMLATEGRISIAELVEEELMLFLPIVPLHENASECAVEPSTPLLAADQEEQPTTQKPFEQLQELLKRK
jgi:uncharacterized protein